MIKIEIQTSRGRIATINLIESIEPVPLPTHGISDLIDDWQIQFEY